MDEQRESRNLGQKEPDREQQITPSLHRRPLPSSLDEGDKAQSATGTSVADKSPGSHTHALRQPSKHSVGRQRAVKTIQATKDQQSDNHDDMQVSCMNEGVPGDRAT